MILLPFNRLCRLLVLLTLLACDARADSLEETFTNPPPAARPGVMWMWMGCNNSKAAITRDLEALHGAGYGRTLMFNLADVTTPWAHPIAKSPTPEIVAWTEPWWALARHAAEESKRLGMEFGMFNGPGYETSGGAWITPELTMQEVCFSQQAVAGGSRVTVVLERAKVDPRAVQLFPVYNPATGKVEKPEIPARKTYYKDVAVLAMPADGVVAKDKIIDLSKHLGADGKLEWDAPAGAWVIYRFGHTTMGTMLQPAQWAANGFECDKMNPEAVAFHMNHVIAEIKKHLGDLIGTGLHSVHVDSYEAGMPSWTPKMRGEFAARRGYDLTPFLATFAKRVVGSEAETGKFRADFDATIKDLYRDVHFAVTSKLLRAAGLTFSCEPYGGPWREEEIMPHVQVVMTEFWTNGGKFTPFHLEPTVAALRKSGQNIIEAEAFTGHPDDSQWSETPAWLKPIGDAAFCAGVNRFILHRYTPQPWDDRHQPGNTMGRWGTHFDRTQTWWEPGKAMVRYWTRCQALLQWGSPGAAPDGFGAVASAGVTVKSMHRRSAEADVFFVANLARTGGEAWCSFQVAGRQPEWWDAVTGTMRDLPQFEERDGRTFLPLTFAPAQSGFVVFRKKAGAKAGGGNVPALKPVTELSGAWDVTFDPKWGGPKMPVKFDTLTDWTQHAEPGIKYFSGTATYRQTFDAPAAGPGLQLSLGTVNCIARVRVNGRDLGVVWCAPWSVSVPAGLLRASGNTLEIDVTNTWANRLIGDEQEPPDCEWLPGHLPGGKFLKEFPDWFLKNTPRPSKGRFCFTTWNYFTKDSSLLPSGLLGPVRLLAEDWTQPLTLTLPKPESSIVSLTGTPSPAGTPSTTLNSEPTPKELPLPGETFLVEGRAAFLIPAKHDSASKEKPWVWYAPTLPNLPGKQERWMFEQFLQAGIAVAGIDVGESFGNPAGRNLFTAFYTELTTRRGFAAKPVLLGRSRGGLMTLSWAEDNADKVAAWAGIYPVCNLASYPGLALAAGAYGFRPDEMETHLKEHNPIDRLASLARARVPLFAIHGDADQVVPLEANSRVLDERYRALGGKIELIVAPNQGHNGWPGFFECRELVDFVKRHATTPAKP